MARECRGSRIAGSALLLGVSGVGVAALVKWGRNWGSTPEERAVSLPGDEFLDSGPGARTVMTRAIGIAVPPVVVWPWVAQLGRGAGWYSYDRLDNAGKPSARHIVSWIPPPAIGDACAIGWLRHLEPGRELVWWLPGLAAYGTTMRSVFDFRVEPHQGGSRLLMRVSGEAAGPLGATVLRVFEAVDSIMAIRQLKGIKARAEAFGARTADSAAPETGERDQFQLNETIWASGGRAGVPGQEEAARWRQDAARAGILNPASD